MSTQIDESQDADTYYDYNDPNINQKARDILVNYSGVPDDNLVPHIRAVRDKAWKVFKYPCVGKYYFLDFSISKSDHYDSVVQRLKNGETLLDLACCMGQDVRRVVYDGAPASNVMGSELQQGFIDIGFELFKDHDTLGGRFTAGDFFSEDVAGLRGTTYDLIHAASFFHLFSWDEQVEVMTKTVRLLKPKPGSMIFGRQTAVRHAVELEHPASKSGTLYRHDITTFKKLVAIVSDKTGKNLDVVVRRADDAEELLADVGWFRIDFAITIV